MVFPAFEAENLLDAEHRVTEAIFQEADLTLLNYWASWCGPCAEELPDLGELSALSEGRVQVVGVLLDGLTVSKDGESTERNEQEIEDALALMADAKAEYPLLMPEGFLGMLSSVITAVPTTFLINRDGRAAGRGIRRAQRGGMAGAGEQPAGGSGNRDGSGNGNGSGNGDGDGSGNGGGSD